MITIEKHVLTKRACFLLLRRSDEACIFFKLSGSIVISRHIINITVKKGECHTDREIYRENSVY